MNESDPETAQTHGGNGQGICCLFCCFFSVCFNIYPNNIHVVIDNYITEMSQSSLVFPVIGNTLYLYDVTLFTLIG